MGPEEREAALASRSAERREAILRKVAEYEAMPARIRENRLRVTQIHYYLMPLLQAGMDQREPLMRVIPEGDRDFIQRRLELWDAMPADIQAAVLEHKKLLSWFVRQEMESEADPVPGGRNDNKGFRQMVSRWETLPLDQRQAVYRHFHRFFELSPKEQEDALAALPQPDRRRIRPAVETLRELPDGERQRTVSAYLKLARMSGTERREFLRSLREWQRLSQDERAAWRRLAQELPPLPPGLAPSRSEPPLPDPLKPASR